MKTDEVRELLIELDCNPDGHERQVTLDRILAIVQELEGEVQQWKDCSHATLERLQASQDRNQRKDDLLSRAKPFAIDVCNSNPNPAAKRQAADWLADYDKVTA